MKNTIDLLSLYQRIFRIKAVVFTTSDPIIDYAKRKGLIVIQEYQRNSFGVPLYRPFLEKLKQLFPSSFYCYINSDILIDPSFFSHLSTLKRLHSSLGVPVNVLGNYDYRCY